MTTVRTNGALVLTLDNPPTKNALTRTMFAELATALRDVREARCVVLRGAGGTFCTGADLSDSTAMGGTDPVASMAELSGVASALDAVRVPTIALVEGLCVGAGMSIAAGCDLVLAARSARFSMIFAKRGLAVDLGGSTFLQRRVGYARALELCLTAELIDADRALALGVCSEVVDDEGFEERAAALVATVAEGPTLALAATKALLRLGAEADLATVLAAEGRAQAAMLQSADLREALRAFAEKRPATFTGS